MSFKTIVVHVDVDRSRDERLALGERLVGRNQGHLIGLYPAEPPYLPPSLGELAGPVEAEMIEAQRQASDARAAELHALFETRLKDSGLSVEWRTEEGDAATVLARHGRYADLLIVPQGEEGSVFPDASLAERVILDGSCPVLMVPRDGTFPSFGDTVLVAWNDSREAARAVRAALPLLTAAQKVVLLQVDPADGSDAQVIDKATQLARHGVRAEAHHTVSAGVPIGEVLLSSIADHDATAMVMGAYGHTRLREWVLGGATRSILSSMTVPTLLAS
ncbi:MAG: universal stress protein [Geminicoccaceae bacterium]|nr:MAG: universal stress protein [Geminicoccaceae bacterium]